MAATASGDIDWRIGLCILLYRDFKVDSQQQWRRFIWMVLPYPNEIQIDEDADAEFEAAYKESLRYVREPQSKLMLLNGLLKTHEDGIIPARRGFRRRPGASRRWPSVRWRGRKRNERARFFAGTPRTKRDNILQS